MAKRSITIAGHRTSVSLERPFWDALAEIAASTDASVASIIATVDRGRSDATSLSGALRLHVLEWYRRRAAKRPR